MDSLSNPIDNPEDLVLLIRAQEAEFAGRPPSEQLYARVYSAINLNQADIDRAHSVARNALADAVGLYKDTLATKRREVRRECLSIEQLERRIRDLSGRPAPTEDWEGAINTLVFQRWSYESRSNIVKEWTL